SSALWPWLYTGEREPLGQGIRPEHAAALHDRELATSRDAGDGAGGGLHELEGGVCGARIGDTDQVVANLAHGLRRRLVGGDVEPVVHLARVAHDDLAVACTRALASDPPL